MPNTYGLCQVILGADTHKDIHVAAVIRTVGALLDTRDLPATVVGYRALLIWPGPSALCLRASVEGTTSFKPH
ncbi:hypothetical protein [Salinispora arenicola]|uniref:hypothetical protein n=1 Tax=Salinispora arenicola TaxID=168697 RepID=UPI000360B78F|nr:hypothetical protein [Salinispora arenicola]